MSTTLSTPVSLRGARRAEPVWRQIQDAADSRISRFEHAFLASAALARGVLDVSGLEHAFNERNEPWAEAVLDRTLAAMTLQLRARLPPVIRETLALGGEVAARDARKRRGFRMKAAAASPFTDLRFDLVNPEAVTWARLHSATLIAQITEETRTAIRTIIRRAFSEGITAANAARMIRPLIGLTDASAAAVLNLRQRMLENPGKKIWAGKTAIRVPEEGATAELLAKRAEQYAQRLLNMRARNIARTETIAAANEGQRQLWLQAVEKGLLRGDEQREWIVTPDNRLCSICEGLNGEVQPLDKPFSVGVMGPPAHGLCRCTTGLSRMQVAAPPVRI